MAELEAVATHRRDERHAFKLADASALRQALEGALAATAIGDLCGVIIPAGTARPPWHVVLRVGTGEDPLGLEMIHWGRLRMEGNMLGTILDGGSLGECWGSKEYLLGIHWGWRGEPLGMEGGSSEDGGNLLGTTGVGEDPLWIAGIL